MRERAASHKDADAAGLRLRLRRLVPPAGVLERLVRKLEQL